MRYKLLNGDWGLGIGPNPRSPIPIKCIFLFKIYENYINNLILYY